MKFIDEVSIEVFAGKGGQGARSFRREKYVPYGGPDGGNGGHGGSVVLVANPNKRTLLDFSYRPKWQAQDGQPGAGSLKDGKAGEDLIVEVPVGTQVYAEGQEDILVDLNSPGQRFVLAKGGRGGKGNSFFKSPTNQVPEHFQPGESGEHGNFRLSLKLVADVGLVGFPNAGKSTLISRLSAARPRIADYPFTTLTPNLGVVKWKSFEPFVIADIPGLIEGAHRGKGLGIQFLKHVERCGILLFVLDLLGFDDQGEPLAPQKAFKTLCNELFSYSPELQSKKMMVALSKADCQPEQQSLESSLEFFREQGIQACVISSVSGQGIESLCQSLAESLVRDQADSAQVANQ